MKYKAFLTDEEIVVIKDELNLYEGKMESLEFYKKYYVNEPEPKG